MAKLIAGWVMAAVAVTAVRAIAVTLLTNIGIGIVIVGALLGYWSAWQWKQARASQRDLDGVLDGGVKKAIDVVGETSETDSSEK